jgi:hypothetical protein
LTKQQWKNVAIGGFVVWVGLHHVDRVTTPGEGVPALGLVALVAGVVGVFQYLRMS